VGGGDLPCRPVGAWRGGADGANTGKPAPTNRSIGWLGLRDYSSNLLLGGAESGYRSATKLAALSGVGLLSVWLFALIALDASPRTTPSRLIDLPRQALLQRQIGQVVCIRPASGSTTEASITTRHRSGPVHHNSGNSRWQTPSAPTRHERRTPAGPFQTESRSQD
jgi:hypothetical protein